jgi:DNA-binding NarL/FixJ family response regulator
MSHPLAVALVEDQRPLREGLAALVDGTPGYQVVGSYESMEAALEGLTSARPDVLLLDIERKVVTMLQRVAPPRETPGDLSPRETQILRLLADGHSYKTAAAELNISPDTVRFHIRHIYEKLHVHSKSEAVLKAFRTGLLR